MIPAGDAAAAIPLLSDGYRGLPEPVDVTQVLRADSARLYRLDEAAWLGEVPALPQHARPESQLPGYAGIFKERRDEAASLGIEINEFLAISLALVLPAAGALAPHVDGRIPEELEPTVGRLTQYPARDRCEECGAAGAKRGPVPAAPGRYEAWIANLCAPCEGETFQQSIEALAPTENDGRDRRFEPGEPVTIVRLETSLVIVGEHGQLWLKLAGHEGRGARERYALHSPRSTFEFLARWALRPPTGLTSNSPLPEPGTSTLDGTEWVLACWRGEILGDVLADLDPAHDHLIVRPDDYQSVVFAGGAGEPGYRLLPGGHDGDRHPLEFFESGRARIVIRLGERLAEETGIAPVKEFAPGWLPLLENVRPKRWRSAGDDPELPLKVKTALISNEGGLYVRFAGLANYAEGRRAAEAIADTALKTCMLCGSTEDTTWLAPEGYKQGGAIVRCHDHIHISSDDWHAGER